MIYENIKQDIRFGIRALKRSLAATVVTVIALAIGIGANSAIFSLVDSMLFKRLPYGDAGRLLSVALFFPKIQARMVPSAEFLTWRGENRTLDGAAAYSVGNFNLAGGGEPERVQGASVTANFLEVLGTSPIIGRNLLAEEDKPGGPCAVLLSNRLWMRRFGGDPSAIGATVKLEVQECAVVGILSPSFRFPADLDVDLLTPLHLPETPNWGDQNMRAVDVIARVKGGVPVKNVQAELTTISTRLNGVVPAGFAQTRAGLEVQSISLREKINGDVRPLLFALMGSVAFVLLIACVNVANLQLARAADRQSEIGTRAALGASQSRIAQQLLTESVLLSLAGGLAGLVVAWSILRFFRALLPHNLAYSLNSVPEFSVLAFTALIAVCAGVLFGLAPVLTLKQTNLALLLKQGSATTTTNRRHLRLRNAQVALELALAMVLLVGSGLLVRSLLKLLNVDPGFNPQSLLTLKISLPGRAYPSPQRQAQFFYDVLERIHRLPSVQLAAAVSSLPLTDYTFAGPILVEGQVEPAPGSSLPIPVLSASSDYFRTMGIPLLSGRFFTDQDKGSSAQVAIVNRAFARRAFGTGEAIGRRITIMGFEPMLVVGVVGDIRHSGLDRDVSPEVFRPYLQAPMLQMAVVVRTYIDPVAIAGAVRKQVLAVDSSQAVYSVETMEEHLRDSLASRRLITVALLIFAAFALVLAAIGVYGVMSYITRRRSSEIGIRMAFGATASDVQRLILAQAGVVAGFGIGGGLLGSFLLSGLIRSFFFETHATDPATLSIVALGLALLVFLAAYLPARNAARVDPITSLHYQ